MQLDSRLSKEIIKIFHNSKGSIQNNIIKWTNNTTDQRVHEKTNWDTYSEQSPNPPTADQYEHRLQQKTYTQLEESLNNSIEENAIFEAQPTTQEADANG